MLWLYCKQLFGIMDSKLSLVDAAAQALHISVEVLPPDLTIKAEVRVS